MNPRPEPADDREVRPAPLHGVVVADFSRVLAGPLATMILADLGADVVKVERPGSGDDTRAWGPPWFGSDSTYSLAANRNKRSVTLDLGDERDLALAHRLAGRADVLVENFRPGGAAGFGLAYEDLCDSNPRLVHASITGFGATGAGAGVGGYDFLIQAMCGLMSVTGPPEGGPQKAGVALVDVVSGLYTAIGVLSALFERERSGQGQQVHVSLFGAGLASMANQASAYLSAGVVPGPLGNAHPSIAPYQTVWASDRPFALAVGSDRLFRLVCAEADVAHLADDDRFATNADRVAHRAELVAELEQAFGKREADTWVRDLRAVGVPAGLVNDVAEAFIEARSLGVDAVVTSRRTDGTAIPTVRSPIRLSATPVEVRSAPPALGEHDAEVRRWLEEGAA